MRFRRRDRDGGWAIDGGRTDVDVVVSDSLGYVAAEKAEVPVEGYRRLAEVRPDTGLTLT